MHFENEICEDTTTTKKLVAHYLLIINIKVMATIINKKWRTDTT